MSNYGYSPEVGVDLLNMLEGVFVKIQKAHQRNGKVAWAGGKTGAFNMLLSYRDQYVRKKDVHDWLQNQNGKIDWQQVPWHKTIALTQHCILRTQSLDFSDSKVDDGRKYHLNVDYAHLFGLEFMARWHENEKE